MREIAMIVPAEMAVAFRLAGVEVLSSRTSREALEHVRDVRARGEHRLVILAEHFLAGMDFHEYRAIMESNHPFFVPIPLDWQATRDARSEFEDHLGRILGCRISLGSQILSRRRKAIVQ
jgi:vacuolar-type H+-ATPase subunit F/Vma7